MTEDAYVEMKRLEMSVPERLVAAARHIDSAVDIDPWARDVAVEAIAYEVLREYYHPNPKQKQSETYDIHELSHDLVRLLGRDKAMAIEMSAKAELGYSFGSRRLG